MDLNHTISEKIQNLPEPLAQEVIDFIDFLLTRQDLARWQQWQIFSESLNIHESDFSDYLHNLEEYEKRLAQSEIRW